MDGSSVFVPDGEMPGPPLRTITVYSGPTQTKRDELRMNVKPGGVHITKWTVYSTGKEVQRSEQWFSREEARALRNALDAIS